MIVLQSTIQLLAPAWVDCLSVAFGLLYTFLAFKFGTRPRRILVKETAFVFGEGASIIPFILLVPAAFSEKMLEAVVSSSRLTLVSAGVMGIIMVAGSRFRTL